VVVFGIEMRVSTLIQVILQMEQKHTLNEHSPSGETNIRSAGQEMPLSFRGPIFIVMLNAFEYMQF